jgi:hypothetical protein
MEVRGVECPHHRARARYRDVEGNGEPQCPGGGHEGAGDLRVVRPHEESTPEGTSPRGRIHPCHRVLESLARLRREREELVHAVEPDRLGIEHRAREGAQPELRPRDEAREAQPADGRREKIGIARRRALHARTVRTQQLEGAHVASERSRAMVVLAVDVVGDRAADRDAARARSHGQEPSGGHDGVEKPLDRGARFAPHDAVHPIEGDEAVEPRRVDEGAALVQAAVAVAASATAREERRLAGQRFVEPKHRVQPPGPLPRETAPGKALLARCAHVAATTTASVANPSARLAGSRSAKTSGSSSSCSR